MNRTCKLLSLLLAVVLLTGLCACGSSAKSAAKYDTVASEAAPAEAPAAAPSMAGGAEMWYDEFSEAEEYGGISPANGTGAKAGDSTGSQTAIQTEKIIYSADATLETTEFDATVDGIYALVESLGGFMESTSISGNNYYNTARGYDTDRNAHFTIRVPSQSFNTLTSSLSELGYVTYCNTYSENITRRYYDTAARLNAYKTQETRLLEMLAIAETVEDMLAIQRQLTEVQYEIDSLTSTLANLDNAVSFSTVNLSVQEVREYTPEPIHTLTFWERMGRGIKNSCKGIGRFFENFVLWLGSALPVLLVIAVLALAVWLIVRRSLRGRDARKARREAKKAARLRKKYARKHPETKDE